MTDSEMDSRKQEKYQECTFGDLENHIRNGFSETGKMISGMDSRTTGKTTETLHQEDQRTSAAKRKRGLAFQQQTNLLCWNGN